MNSERPSDDEAGTFCPSSDSRRRLILSFCLWAGFVCLGNVTFPPIIAAVDFSPAALLTVIPIVAAFVFAEIAVLATFVTMWTARRWMKIAVTCVVLTISVGNFTLALILVADLAEYFREMATLLSIPVDILLGTMLPLWLLSAFGNWRLISLHESAFQPRQSMAISDLWIAMTFVAVAILLTTLSFDPKDPEDVWFTLGVGIGVTAVVSLFVLVPVVFLCFRATASITAIMNAAFVVGGTSFVVAIVFSVVMLNGLGLEFRDFILPVTSFPVAMTVFVVAPLAIARLLGVRLKTEKDDR